MSARRTAVLGAATLAGRELLELLGRDRAKLGRLALAEAGGEEAVASAVAGEWIVSTPLMDEALEDAGLVLCCSRLAGEAAEAVAQAARSATVIDVAGSLGGAPFDARAGASLASLGPGVHSSPAASSFLVAGLARAAARAGARERCVATVLEPASEIGREAVEELTAQAIALLNFQPLPTAVFGRQAVHDAHCPGPDGELLEARLRREIEALGGGDVALVVIRPGLFHGVGVALHAEVEARAWREALSSEPRLALDAGEEGRVSPVAAVGLERATVGRIVPDGRAGAWAWAVADPVAHGAVGNAVDLIRAS